MAEPNQQVGAGMGPGANSQAIGSGVPTKQVTCLEENGSSINVDVNTVSTDSWKEYSNVTPPIAVGAMVAENGTNKEVSSLICILR